MSEQVAVRGLRKQWKFGRERYGRFADPSRSGLPRLRVLFSFPLILLIVGAILVGIGLNGSSSGAYYPEIATGSDPDLIAGEPQKVRSDEWNVGIPWVIAQVEQGLPEENQTHPGGMDADLPYDLPHTGLSMVFKPHLWGFLFLDVDQAIAWKWWLPGLALIAAAFMFLVTVLPRRPILAAGIAVAFFYSPFFQWWYQTTTLWPVTWALVALTAMIWCITVTKVRHAWWWAVPVGYLTVTMAMGVYAPFIIPVAYVVIFAAVGLVIQGVRHGLRLPAVFSRAAPVVVGAIAGAIVLLVWLRSKQETVNGFLSTVYPGERLWPTGAGGPITVAQTISASFSDSLRYSGGFLGLNSSEASTFFFVGIFLIPVLVWMIVHRVRAKQPLPWLAIALTAVVMLFVAWLFVPGWDALSHLMLLDRTSPGRLRIGLGLASLALLACVIREIASEKPGRIFAASVAALFLASQVAVAAAVLLVLDADHLWGAAPLWWLWALLSTAVIYLYARGRAAIATALLLIVAIATSATVHPIYRGVLDLRETAVSQQVQELDEAAPEAWVGVGGSFVSAVLLESGVEAYNGTQGAPSQEMWQKIDADGEFEQQWNRIGAVRWMPGEGEPTVTNPAPDVIMSTFDACSDFAQRNVGRVLADSDLDSPCLVEVGSVEMPLYTVTIYEVVPATSRDATDK